MNSPQTVHFLLSAFSAIFAVLLLYIAVAAFDFSNKVPFLKMVLKNAMASLVGCGLFLIAVFLYVVVFIVLSPVVKYANGFIGVSSKILFGIFIGFGTGLGLFTLLMELQGFDTTATIIGSKKTTNAGVGLVSLVTGFLAAFTVVNSQSISEFSQSSFFYVAVVLTGFLSGLFAAERSLFWQGRAMEKGAATLMSLITVPLIFCAPLLAYHYQFVGLFSGSGQTSRMLVIRNSFAKGIELAGCYLIAAIILSALSGRRNRRK